MSRYYDPDGEPITLEQWIARFGHEPPLAQAQVGEARVSTVWLGLDHQFGIGPPLIFETMIFGGPLDQEQWRYSTREQAVAGHARAVQQATEAQSQEGSNGQSTSALKRSAAAGDGGAARDPRRREHRGR